MSEPSRYCEFNAIHPFREGKGRTIRLFLDLTAFKMGFNFIDLSEIKKSTYINACMAGMHKNYQPIAHLF